MPKTTIEVSEETWRELNQRKAPGDSFDEVLREHLDPISGDSFDRLLWFKDEDEPLSAAVDRVTSVMAGPGQFRDAHVDPTQVDEEDFVLSHIQNVDGIYEPRVYRSPGAIAREVNQAIEASHE